MTTATEYPEHLKFRAAKRDTDAVGAFLEWLAEQGIHLMVWRENVPDVIPASPFCHADGRRTRLTCRPERDGGHCLCWQAGDGDCHLCGGTQETEITRDAWLPAGRTIEQLLAGWAGIDLAKLEDEKRAVLAACRAGE